MKTQKILPCTLLSSNFILFFAVFSSTKQHPGAKIRHHAYHDLSRKNVELKKRENYVLKISIFEDNICKIQIRLPVLDESKIFMKSFNFGRLTSQY